MFENATGSTKEKKGVLLAVHTGLFNYYSALTTIKLLPAASDLWTALALDLACQVK